MNKEIKKSIKNIKTELKNIKTELKNINIVTEKSTNQHEQPQHQQPQHQQPQHQQPHNQQPQQSQNTPAGYLGPQINHSHSYWTNSLRNHYY